MFDVDKLFLATMYYKNGKLETEDSDAPSKFATTNRLLLNYIQIISNPKNYAQSRASIDTFTKVLKDQLLPLLQDKSTDYLPGGYQLTPSFQSMRKMEFSVGKAGIGPFALNITNLALTQYTHLTLDFGNNPFGLLPLDSIQGKDGMMIAGWLSAMVNAHVDVAKDPYIFALNINRSTYNHANLLIRTGNGMATFAFLAQPILKLYAQKKNNRGGVYGSDLTGDNDKYQESVGKECIRKYVSDIGDLLKSNSIKDENLLAKAKEVYAYFDYKINRKNYKKAPKLGNVNWEHIISLEANKKSLNDLNSNTLEGRLAHDVHQLLSLNAFERLDSYAQALSKMVTCSLIDTKKFGNNITLQRLFINKVNNFRYDHGNVLWTINTKEFLDNIPLDSNGKTDKHVASNKALNAYFESMFLADKLYNAVGLTQSILSNLHIIATKTFDRLFTNVMQDLYGRKEFVDTSEGRESMSKIVAIGYEDVTNKDSAVQIATAIDNVCRFNILMNRGPEIYRTMSENNPQMIDFTLGGRLSEIQDKMSELYYGTSTMPSLFQRLSALVLELRTNPRAIDSNGRLAYEGLVDNNGKVLNDLLLYLEPVLPTKKYPLGRMMLSQSQMDVPGNLKSRYVSAFDLLLSSPNSLIRELAHDLAFFAYHSQYDLNTPGSFFELVPPNYRSQYDTAIANAIDMLNDDNVSDDEKYQSVGTLNNSSNYNILDVISRNYWYNNDVVPIDDYKDIEYDSRNDPRNIFNEYGDKETVIAKASDRNAGVTFPGLILSTKNKKGNGKYFKLQKNGVAYLYKKIAYIKRTPKNDLGKADYIYVWCVVPRAGYKQKGVTQFELYADYSADSMFFDNAISDELAENNLRDRLIDRINRYNSNDSNKNTLELYDWDNIPETRQSYNLGTYILSNDREDASNVGKTNIVKSMNSTTGPDHMGQYNADVVINLSLYPVEKDLDGNPIRPGKRIKKIYENKVFDWQFGQLLDKQTFYDFVQSLKTGESEDSQSTGKSIHISTPIEDWMFTKNYERLPQSVRDRIESKRSEIIEQLVSEYKDLLLQEGTDLTQIDALEQVYRNSLNEDRQVRRINKQAASEVTREIINDISEQIVDSGADISTITTFINKDALLISEGVAYYMANNSNDIKHSTFVNNQMPLLNQFKYYLYIRSLRSIYDTNTPIANETTDVKLENQITKAIEETNNSELTQSVVDMEYDDFEGEEYDISDDILDEVDDGIKESDNC